MTLCPRFTATALSPAMVRGMSAADRAALGIETATSAAVTLGELPTETKADIRNERALMTVCTGILTQRLIAWHHERNPRKNKKGWPDVVCACTGRPLAFEFKFGIGKLTPEQVEVLTMMKDNGWEVYLIREVGEFLDALAGIGEQWETQNKEG